MAANDRFMQIIVPEDRLHDAGLLTTMAANAQLRLQKHTAALTLDQGTARTGLHAGRVVAGNADNRDEAAGHAAPGPDLDRAFGIGMILPIDNRANIHACETANAFVHLTGRQIFRHSGSPFIFHKSIRITPESHLFSGQFQPTVEHIRVGFECMSPRKRFRTAIERIIRKLYRHFNPLLGQFN